MIPVNLNYDNLLIKNIDTEEVADVFNCINESLENCRALGKESLFTFEEIFQRYLETLTNSMEFFCSINMEGKIIGILKGRIENKTSKCLWILSLLIREEYRDRGIGRKVINSITEYFTENMGVEYVYVLVLGENKRSIEFWKGNCFEHSRAIMGERYDDSLKNMIVLKRKVI